MIIFRDSSLISSDSVFLAISCKGNLELFREIWQSKTVELQEDETVATTNSAEQLSVRERMQRFNRMASETDLPARPNDTTSHARKRADKVSDLLYFFSLTIEALRKIQI